MLDNLILGLLGLGPLSGYDLGKWMDGPGRFTGYRVTLPQVYRTLSKLVERDLVRYEIEPREGKPDAKVYRLTETGTQALLDWAHSPFEPAPRPMDPDFMLRFLLTGVLGRDYAISVLRTELDYRRAQVRNPTRVDEWVSALDPLDLIDPRWAATVLRAAHDQGRASTASYIGWLEVTLADFENRPDS
ncbi:DNA-binding PadR family transcriptional regulator [Nocardia tenerifensis]|uniref:DNA-binding PadR family transcriptional regulator n=1 Tax=Nocardia tenerifensis TaxID=228006 RepID=A0A318JU16_9NOCA|nr:PadR family transcriptional regulator [Nocardia tenerifensis]PXX54938.1 DNA-binding PadR family transcriptional regulator [Nocardia tenerifensis]